MVVAVLITALVVLAVTLALAVTAAVAGHRGRGLAGPPPVALPPRIDPPPEPLPRLGLDPPGGADAEPIATDDPESLRARIAALDLDAPDLPAHLDRLLGALEVALGAPVVLDLRPRLALPAARSLRWSAALDLLIVRGDDAFVGVDLESRRAILRGRASGSMSIADTFDARIGPFHTWRFTWTVSGTGLLGQSPGAGSDPAAIVQMLAARRRARGLAGGDEAQAAIGAELAIEAQEQTIGGRAGGGRPRPPPLEGRGPAPHATPPTGAAIELPEGGDGGARRAEIRGDAVIIHGPEGPRPLADPPQIAARALALAGDGSVAAHALDDGHLHLWWSDPLRGQALDLDVAAHALAFTADGEHLAWAAGDALGLLRLADAAIVWRREVPRGWSTIAAGPWGVVAATVDGRVVALDHAGRERGAAAIGDVAELAALADGDVALLLFDSRALRWTPTDGALVPLLEAAPEGYHRLAASADGRALALAAWDRILQIDPATREIITRTPVRATVESLALSDRGELLVGLRGVVGEPPSLLLVPPDRPPRRVRFEGGERPAFAPAAGLWGALRSDGEVLLGDVGSGRIVLTRRDLAGVGGLQRHGGALEGWGEWSAAIVASVGPLALPRAPLLVAATTAGLWARRLAAIRGAPG